MPDSDDVVPMVMCPQCEHLVPEPNLALHEARCQGRKRPARDTETTESDNSDEHECSADEGNRNNQQRNIRQHLSNSTEREPFLPRASWEARNGRSSATSEDDDDDDDDDENLYYHDETSEDEGIVSPPAAAAAAAASAPPQHEVIDLIGDEENEEKWNCPRCTLVNPVSTTQCEACSYHRPDSERPPDPVRRERLVGEPQPANNGNPNGFMNPSAASAALIGGILGGGAAHLRGENFAGLFNSALSGSLGGVLLNELTRNDQRLATPRLQQQQQTTFTTMTNGGAPRSISIVRNPDGTITTQSSGMQQMQQNRNMNGIPSIEVQQMLQIIAQSAANRAGAGNPDNMSYEQLLQAFGTGGENMGANAGQIRSLPTASIADVERLPSDSRQCSICLEEFKNGDERKILPCLHGFHASCVDKWLHTNGSCPICKHRLDR